jgi:hypothetical protein
MAELKNYVMSVIAVLFIATAAVSIYAVALSNNLASGGSGTDVPFPLLNQTTAYTAQMNTFSEQMANSTLSAASTPSAGLGSLGGGIGAITQAGTGAVSLSFSSISILITMLSSFMVSLTPVGVPPIVFGFGILTVTVSIVFAILAAVFKWWI